VVRRRVRRLVRRELEAEQTDKAHRREVRKDQKGARWRVAEQREAKNRRNGRGDRVLKTWRAGGMGDSFGDPSGWGELGGAD